MSTEPRTFRVRQTRTGRWVGEAHTPGDRYREWTSLTGGQDADDTRANVIDDFVRRRGQTVRFDGEDEIYTPESIAC